MHFLEQGPRQTTSTTTPGDPVVATSAAKVLPASSDLTVSEANSGPKSYFIHHHHLPRSSSEDLKTTAVVQWNHSSPQATAAGDLPLSQNFPGQGKQLPAGGEHQDSPKQLKSSQLLSLVAKPKDSEDKEVTAAVSPTASASTRLSSGEDGSKDSIDLACLTVVEDANEKDDSGCRNNDCDIEGSEKDVQVARGWSGPGCVMTNTNSAPAAAADPTSLPALPGEVADMKKFSQKSNQT